MNGIYKLNIARFDKSGKASWSRNFESMNNHTPQNIHQQGTGFLVVGETDTLQQGMPPYSNGFLLKVDSSGQITNHATGDCQTVNRPFSASPGSVQEVSVEARQANDISGISWKPVNILSQGIDVLPTSHCTQNASGGAVSLKQKGNGCSLKDTLVFFLQGAATSDAPATWQYDSLYFHLLFSIGDSIWLQPVREGRSVVSASVEGNCSLSSQQINTLISRPASSVNLGPDTVLCTGNTIKLSAGPGFAGYLWNDNSSDSTLTVNTTGKYYVQVADLCGGKAADTIQVHPGALPTNFLPADTIICSYSGALIQVRGDFEQYNWSTGETGKSIQVKTAGKYDCHVVSRDGCQGTESIRIDLKDCEALLVFPNAFTPNHDGVNDVFRLKYPGHAADYNLQIFNRQGQKIFETSDPSAGWDGTFNGQHTARRNLCLDLTVYRWIREETEFAGECGVDKMK